MIPEGTQSELLGPLWRALGHQWGHFDVPVPPQSPFKTLSKINRNFGDFRYPPGGGCDNRGPGSPPSIKRTFSAKVAISLQRGANFQFLDFGTPLEKSVSLTFSEQWLCHFSKKEVSVGRSGRTTQRRKTTRLSRARGTAADINIEIHCL